MRKLFVIALIEAIGLAVLSVGYRYYERRTRRQEQYMSVNWQAPRHPLDPWERE